MFRQVWKWAGLYRQSEPNIGIDPHQIAIAISDLVADAAWWFGPQVTWITPDAALCRIHHRLVAIHPFPNGNGRHAREYANLLAAAVGRPVFTWGSGATLTNTGPDRRAYIAALRAVDRDPEALGPLVEFARS